MTTYSILNGGFNHQNREKKFGNPEMMVIAEQLVLTKFDVER